MRLFCAMPCAALFACSLSCFGQTTATCNEKLTAPLQSRAFLFIDSRPAGLEIVGTDEQTIHITCKASANDPNGPGHILLRFNPSSSGGKLTIEGTHLSHGDNLQVKIEVPRKTNLAIRMAAGQVKVNEVTGDKDVYLYAGQITISDHDWNYRKVNASVSIGEVRAPMYDADKGGFFRSITKRSRDGEYQLHAHVTTGEIDLLGRRTGPETGSRPD